jgi:hypothetical protein
LNLTEHAPEETQHVAIFYVGLRCFLLFILTFEKTVSSLIFFNLVFDTGRWQNDKFLICSSFKQWLYITIHSKIL